jgi:hypothetical protein
MSAQSVQSTDINFRVVDGAGFPIQRATVTVFSDTPNERKARSNESGDVTLGNITCDSKQAVEIVATGFGTLRITDISSCEHVGEILNVCLVAEVVEIVVIRCPGPLVDLDRSHKSMTFSSQTLADLPGVGGDSRGAVPARTRTTDRPECQQVSWYSKTP